MRAVRWIGSCRGAWGECGQVASLTTSLTGVAEMVSGLGMDFAVEIGD